MNRIFSQTQLFARPAVLGNRFSSSAAPSSAPSRGPLYAAIVAATAAGAYYIMSNGPPEKKGLRDLEEKAKAAAAPAALNPEKFQNFKLRAIENYNHDTAKFIFDLPEGTKSGIETCSAILVKSATEGQGLGSNGKAAIRPYTPISKHDTIGEMHLLIKSYKDGVISKHIHSLKPGDELAIKGPIPKWQYKPNEFQHIGLVAGGSGITPIYQLLDVIASNPSDRTKVTLIYANKSKDDILLKEKLDEIAKSRPEQFKFHYTVDTAPSSWEGLTGFVDRSKLETHMPAPGLADATKIFVCGPPGQMESISGNKKSPSDQGDLKGHLADLGYQPSQVYKF